MNDETAAKMSENKGTEDTPNVTISTSTDEQNSELRKAVIRSEDTEQELDTSSLEEKSLEELVALASEMLVLTPKAAADKLKNSGYKFGNMSLGNSSMDEVIRLGSSADTAKKLGKAKKEKGFFSKTVTTGDNSPIRTTEPVKDSGPTAQEKADADKAAKDAADKKKADDAAKTKRAEDFRKKENRRAESQGGGDFHSNMVAKAQERQKQTRAGQQAGKGYVGGFGFDKGGLMKRKK